ncbi:MAG: hypothetical protein H7Z17_16080 [Fuerstia sp.]|nr:hypothetical protein [Fuerstiella sp.]
MWCSHCRTDVSVRTTGHAGGLLCSRCGQDLLSTTRPSDAIQHAREILERWNSSDLFERISRTESLDSLHTRFEAVKKSDAQKRLLSAGFVESVAPEEHRQTEVVIEEQQSDAPLADTQPIEIPVEAAVSQAAEESRVEDPGNVENSVDVAPRVQSDLSSDSSAEVAQQETETHEVAHIDSRDGIADSTASPAVVAEALPPAIETEPTESRPVAAVPTAKTPTRIVNLSELTHTDILSVRTVANSVVTGKGITNELQRVMDLARAQNADPMSITEGDSSHERLDIIAVATAEAAAADPPDLTQSSLPAFNAGVVSSAQLQQSPQIPAETANGSELVSAAEPKKIVRSPMRRPLLHRRFQLERPATTSSTGSENVNRKLRVDQPGGSNDLPEAAAVQQDASVVSSVAPDTKIVSNSPKPGRRIRIDGAESVDSVTGTDGRRGRTQTLPKHRYIDDAHESAMRGPHFEITAPRRSNLTSVTGQFLAYLGVLGLTVGTAMVIYGHFGGYSEYTPTGWLVTTVAQMLLFLGVINLVSGGIEQNNDDVSRRINTLGEQLLRIEQVTADAMKGPKLSPRLYDNPNAEVEESSRETAGINRE